MDGDGPEARIVIVGKGGVGKTTVTAVMARLLARRGCSVIAVDGDEQCNLGPALGVTPEMLVQVTPITEAGDYMAEKTGTRPGANGGGMLRLNPDTTDVVDRLSVIGPDGVRFLMMGAVRRAGGGCFCPETALLAAALRDMRSHHGSVVLLDTHAGVEHFGRALARGFNQAVVVVDHTANAVQVGMDTARLAGSMGIDTIHLLVNRVRTDEHLQRAMRYVAEQGGYPFASIHNLPYDEVALEAEPAVDALLESTALAGGIGSLGSELIPFPTRGTFLVGQR
ncbi:MAG TPA: AAA family ATPase [Acidimicrobiales bacterium]|nr:AAA family ATPase [Acidimicrobiales bacterium]